MGNRLEFKQALDRMDIPELAREAQRLAREIEESENTSELQIEELELVQRALSVRRAPTAGRRAEQREMALTADGCIDVGLTGDGPTDDEECLLGAMRALGVLPGEAIRLLSGGAGPRGPRDGDQGQEDGEQGQGQGQEGGQEQAEDDDDQEGDDQGDERIGAERRARPLYRQTMTFSAPADDAYDAESVSLEVIVCHERTEGLASVHDLPEHNEAGWRWWAFGNFEVGVRPVGD